MSSFVEVGFPTCDDAERKTEQEPHNVTIELGVGLSVEDVFERENDDFDQVLRQKSGQLETFVGSTDT